MKKLLYVFSFMFTFVAAAASYTAADVEFIAKSNDSISYINTVEARELQIAESSTSLLDDLAAFYSDLAAAGAKGSQLKFLDRRRAAIQKVIEWVKGDDPVKSLESKLMNLSQNKPEIFREKSEEQSLAVIIHLFARNQAVVLNKSTLDVAFLAGASAFHSSLLGNEYLKRFLDLSDQKDKRRAQAREMLQLIEAVKK